MNLVDQYFIILSGLSVGFYLSCLPIVWCHFVFSKMYAKQLCLKKFYLLNAALFKNTDFYCCCYFMHLITFLYFIMGKRMKILFQVVKEWLELNKYLNFNGFLFLLSIVFWLLKCKVQLWTPLKSHFFQGTRPCGRGALHPRGVKNCVHWPSWWHVQ